MSVSTSSPVISTPAQEMSTWRFRSYVVFALCACLYILPFMRLYMLGTDEGILDYGAVRIAHGQVFARDFFEVMGPGTFYWLAAFYKIFGVSFFATRICLFVTSLGTALAMYFLSRRVCKRYQLLPCVIVAGTYFGGLWPAMSHHVDSNFFALLAVVSMVLWHGRGDNRLLLLAGALAGVTTCFIQPKGMLLLCAFLLWLWTQRRARSLSIASLSLVLGSYVSIIGLVMIYFWSRGALGNLVFDNLVWPSRHYESVNAVHYANSIRLNYWDHWVVTAKGFAWTIPMGIVLITPVVFIAALPGLVLTLGARYKWHVNKPEVLLYWLCGAAVWVAELYRMDMTHLVFGSPILIIVCVHFLAEYRDKVAEVATKLLTACAGFLAVFNLLCLLLASHSISTRVGTVKMFKELPVLSYLQSHVAPGEEMFAYPYCPKYYFLAGTTNPTPYSVLLNSYNTPSQFQETVSILEQHKVRYVVWDTNLADVAASVFPGSTRPPPGGFIMEPYLESHYKNVQVVDGFRIMERK